MSAQRPLSDASASESGHDDDGLLDANFVEFEAQIARDLFGSTSSPSSAPARRGRRLNATHMVEAFETLSHDTEANTNAESVPQSLRGLLDQLQSGDSAILDSRFPFSQQLQSSGGNPRFPKILEQIGATQSVHTQMAALTELCETLALASEETLAVSGFSVDKFVPAVVALLRLPPSIDLLLLAARALSTILELFPSTAIPRAAAEHVIPSLCQKLREIEYMDVAELALQILDIIVCKTDEAFRPVVAVPSVTQLGAQYRTEVITEDGIVALLQFVDFFQLDIQRRAARIVCHLCTDFPLALCEKLRQGLPLITNLLRSDDPEILQTSFACLQKLADSSACSSNVEFASMVATDEICDLLVANLLSYVNLPEPSSSPSAHLSPLGILRFLYWYLSCVSRDSRNARLTCSASQLQFVQLPPIVTALLAKKEVLIDSDVLGETLKLVLVLLPTPKDTRTTDKVPLHLLRLAHDILPLLIGVYDVTSRADVRLDCLTVMYQSSLVVQGSKQPIGVFFERTETLRLAAFLARVLRSKRNGTTTTALCSEDPELASVVMALRIIKVLLLHSSTREPAQYSIERHGVAKIIRLYAASANQVKARDGNLQEAQTLSVWLVDEYLGAESLSVSMMVQLEQLVVELQAVSRSCRPEKGDQDLLLVGMLRKLCDFVHEGEDFLTVHEIVSSGLVKALVAFLSDRKGQRAFCQMLQDPGSHGLTFVTSLLQCLQDAISSEKDAFLISHYDGSSELSSGSIATDLDQLTQHIKVHVRINESKPAAEPDHEDNSTQKAEAHENHWIKTMSSKRNRHQLSPSSVHDTIVLVEPLARIETIEDFIADKLFGQFGRGEPLADAGADLEERENIDESGEFANEVNKRRRVVAVYNEHVLSTDMSLLEAIVKFGDVGGGRASAFRTHIWRSLPHDVTFRVVASGECCVSSRLEARTAGKRGFLEPSDNVGSSEWCHEVWDLLLLLKLVRQQITEQSCGTGLTFTSSYLSLQVRRALQQPIRVVTNSLPHWCFRLMNEFAFVLEFETRCHFMYATTSGCARAIPYLCRSVWKSAVLEEPAPSRSRRRHLDALNRTRSTFGLQNLSQMVKLPRLKVRVTRSRLLQSAMKLVAIYGGKKAVIEIEFLGEVGTGLGPTTEFYTLVCQQIQSKQLQLWMDDDRIGSGRKDVTDGEHKRMPIEDGLTMLQNQSSLVIRGYHRVAVYHCTKCKVLRIPTCSSHRQLLSHEKRADKTAVADRARSTRHSIPQCAKCLDECDWHSAAMSCKCDDNQTCTLKWWILSTDEAQYLAKVFPRHAKRVYHPVLQCAHCETVNFPGTDAGIVEMDGDRMVTRSGRRMYERDYRAVTKHVSPLCEGTPLNVIISTITRSNVDELVTNLAMTPEVLESEIESFNYLQEAVAGTKNVGRGPPVTAPFGLYPKPYLGNDNLDELKAPVQVKSRETTVSRDAATLCKAEVDVITWFRFLGRIVGQAILDERLLNLPLARPFWRALRGEQMVGDGVSIETSLSFVEELDPSIANSLRYLHELTVKYAATTTAREVEASPDVAQWTSDVEALYRSFTLIGADEIPLEAGGEKIPVTLPSLQRYVALNLEFLLDRTIKCQVQAFRQGFEQICGGAQLVQYLRAFDVWELEELLSDRSTGSTMWDRHGLELREHMVCDHGYTTTSRAIAHLVSILCELSVDEQRLFVRFVTGANRLPLGGLRNLAPKLTVVRKLPDAKSSLYEHDAVLPSASTCTNYLKLPDYSTRDMMKQRLLYCITEGQGSFHLS